MKARASTAAVVVLLLIIPIAFAAPGNMTSKTFATLASPTMENFLDITEPTDADLAHLKTANIADWYRYMNTKADFNDDLARDAAEQHLGTMAPPLKKEDYAIANKYCQQVALLSACLFDNANDVRLTDGNFVIDGKTLDMDTLSGCTVSTKEDGTLIIKANTEKINIITGGINIKQGANVLQFAAEKNTVITIGKDGGISTLGTVITSIKTPDNRIQRAYTKNPTGQTDIKVDEKGLMTSITTTTGCLMDGTYVGDRPDNFITINAGGEAIINPESISMKNGKAQLKTEGNQLQLTGDFETRSDKNARVTLFIVSGKDSAAILLSERTGTTTLLRPSNQENKIYCTTDPEEYKKQGKNAALVNPNGGLLETSKGVRFKIKKDSEIDTDAPAKPKTPPERENAPFEPERQNEYDYILSPENGPTTTHLDKEWNKAIITTETNDATGKDKLLMGPTEMLKPDIGGPLYFGPLANIILSYYLGSTIGVTMPSEPGSIKFSNGLKSVPYDSPGLGELGRDLRLPGALPEETQGTETEPEATTTEILPETPPEETPKTTPETPVTSEDKPTPSTEPEPEPLDVEAVKKQIKMAYTTSKVQTGSERFGNQEEIQFTGLPVSPPLGELLKMIVNKNVDDTIAGNNKKIEELRTLSGNSDDKNIKAEIKRLTTENNDKKTFKLGIEQLQPMTNKQKDEQKPKLLIYEIVRIGNNYKVSSKVAVVLYGVHHVIPVPPMTLTPEDVKSLLEKLPPIDVATGRKIK